MAVAAARKTLSAAVAESLLADIRKRKYAVGDQLPTLQELMDDHKVGYGVAREAMQQLVALGIADIRPKRGAVVLQVNATSALDDATLAALLSDQAVDELYELRRLVEVATAGQAARRLTPERLASIREAQARFEQAAGMSQPVNTADVELHAAIALMSENSVFVKVLDSLRGVLAEVRRAAAIIPGATQRAIDEHAAIVEAIARGDEAGARRAMDAHIDTAKDTVLRVRTLQPGERARSNKQPQPVWTAESDED